MSAEFADYYESLQLSPNADGDTIHRVYRLLAQRFHPDHKDSGNLEVFRSITEAYHTLSDPERRASYDVQHRQRRRLNWKIFDQANTALGVEAERHKRQGVLALLYRKRVSEPADSFMVIREFEELLGVPREHLEFTLWYLKEEQNVTRTDNGRYSITALGVRIAEEMITERPDITPIGYLPPAVLAAVG